ncbi:RNA dependent RNA polymerase-domain-containing protein [Podospora australis]|uniref:RNA-dependent RNA polymerase n=1 Tax=Podospora australis TaxID=1536484 RepID=A0AAN6WKW7_9PEZI|nr:RNA dependent RNA polymerase-domain-containing protein [Podospora australis]
MEAFLHRVPSDLSERGLERELKPLMEQLGITEWICEKAKSKSFGQITFLHEQDGKRFLEKHGQKTSTTPQPISRDKHQKYPSATPRLSLRNQDVFCQLSKNKPSETALKGIQHDISERRRRALEKERSKANEKAEKAEKPMDSVRPFVATGLCCGFHTFIDGRFTFVAEWSTVEHITVKFGKRFLIFSLSPTRSPKVEVRISYQSIVSVVWSDHGSASVTLSGAPNVLQDPEDFAAQLLHLGISETNRFDRPPDRLRVDAIDDSHRFVSPFCLVYHFRSPLPVTGYGRSDFHTEIWKLKQKELFDVIRYDLGFQHSVKIPNLGHFPDALNALREKLERYHQRNALPFGLLFLLQALVYNGYLHPLTVGEVADRLVQLFQDVDPNDTRPPISVDAFKKLFEWIDYPVPHADPQSFEASAIMQLLRKAETQVRESCAARSMLFKETETLIRVFRVVVSPFRITFHGPDLETKNRVLRRYGDHTDYFLRAQFCDETGQDLFFTPGVSLEPIYDRFKAVLARGISIAGRVYKFLGFSHSSLRAHSVWLSAPFVYQGTLKIPALIIEGLGRFNKIKSPARRAARIGQAFSETPYTVSLDEYQIEVKRIPDIERCHRVFSDGVGTISLGAVESIHTLIPESKGSPTCFQIRWAGVKGMLSLDTRLEGNVICVRDSMTKFESDERSFLEICDMAYKPIPMVLNLQLIKILEDMGAPDCWFLELQDQEVRRLRAITATVYNTASYLRIHSICEGVRLYAILRQAEDMGIDYRRDTFLRNAIEAILLKELKLLKHKGRIPVRKGITLFGVLDETGFLKEGEIYVTFKNNPNQDRHSDPPPKFNPVIVTRSPALHPGDIQLATNMVPPEGHPLAALCNCVVFSQKGSRDLPSQLSGGDLDGDIFNIIWDQEVVSEVRTFSAANYPRTHPMESDMTVEDFFVEFMKADKLGVIANRHKIVADYKDSGTRHDDAIKLAELHSNAVDFSKTGRPVELKELPRPNKNWRPDFLAPGTQITIHNKSEIDLDEHLAQDDNADDEGNEGPKYRYYLSEKILGQLYRAVDEHRIWNEDIKMTVPSGGSSFWEEFRTALDARVAAIGVLNWRRRSEEAQRIRHAYEDAVFSTMIGCSDHPYQPLRELEVFVGFIINKSGIQSNRQRDKSIKIKDEFERITNWIIKDMCNPSSEDGQPGEFAALELCLACVHIGCIDQFRETEAWNRSSSQDLQTFKIVAASALIRELNVLEAQTAGVSSGGYVGTRTGPGSYSSVPPPDQCPVPQAFTKGQPAAQLSEI